MIAFRDCVQSAVGSGAYEGDTYRLSFWRLSWFGKLQGWPPGHDLNPRHQRRTVRAQPAPPARPLASLTREQRPESGARLDQSRSSPADLGGPSLVEHCGSETAMEDVFLRGAERLSNRQVTRGPGQCPPEGRGHALDRLKSSAIVKPVHSGATPQR
jgi:hypothetical protein